MTLPSDSAGRAKRAEAAEARVQELETDLHRLEELNRSLTHVGATAVRRIAALEAENATLRNTRNAQNEVLAGVEQENTALERQVAVMREALREAKKFALAHFRPDSNGYYDYFVDDFVVACDAALSSTTPPKEEPR